MPRQPMSGQWDVLAPLRTCTTWESFFTSLGVDFRLFRGAASLPSLGMESGGDLTESRVDQIPRSPKSCNAARAALNPQAPWTPAPGWVEAEAR